MNKTSAREWLIKAWHHFSSDDSEIDLLIIISEYHIMESYPAFNRSLPTRDEIKKVMNFAQNYLIEYVKFLILINRKL